MLEDRIKADLTAAMRARDTLRLSVLRLLLSAISYKRIEVQRGLTDDDILAVVQREVKKRKQAIESFTAGGRAESAKKEKQEMEILQTYLLAKNG